MSDDDDDFPEPVRRSTWSPPPRRPTEEASSAAAGAADDDNDDASTATQSRASSPARSPNSYSGLNLTLSPKAPVVGGGGGGGSNGKGAAAAATKALEDSSDEEDLDPENETIDEVSEQDLSTSPAPAPAARAKAAAAASDSTPAQAAASSGGGGSKPASVSPQRRHSKRMLDLTKQAQELVQQKMRTENVLSLEEASKILSVLPSAALGALTAPRYIGEDWFEVMGPDRRTSYVIVVAAAAAAVVFRREFCRSAEFLCFSYLPLFGWSVGL
jgi:hypothetical protein